MSLTIMVLIGSKTMLQYIAIDHCRQFHRWSWACWRPRNYSKDWMRSLVVRMWRMLIRSWCYRKNTVRSSLNTIMSHYSIWTSFSKNFVVQCLWISCQVNAILQIDNYHSKLCNDHYSQGPMQWAISIWSPTHTGPRLMTLCKWGISHDLLDAKYKFTQHSWYIRAKHRRCFQICGCRYSVIVSWTLYVLETYCTISSRYIMYVLVVYYIGGVGRVTCYSFNSHFSFSLLGCYPFQDQDPFIIDQSPHVYFVGNQSKFEHSLIEGKTICYHAWGKYTDRFIIYKVLMDKKSAWSWYLPLPKLGRSSS